MSGQPVPPEITQAFGVDATGPYITTPIPDSPGDPGRASFSEGFPPVTMTPVVAGGIPPFGQDVNGILNMVSSHCAALNAGQLYKYSATVSAAMGGYLQGAILAMTDGTGYWLNITDGNTTDPDAGGAGWTAIYRYGYATLSGLTGGTVTPAMSDAKAPVIVLSGALVANLRIVLPALLRSWLIVNLTTGAFTTTVATVSGVGVLIPQGGYAAPVEVYGNGADIFFTVAPLTIPGAVAPTPDTYVLRSNLGYIYGTYLNQNSGLENPTIGAVLVQSDAADGFLRKISQANFRAQIFQDAALTGAPTAPTPAAGDSSTAIATTAFVGGTFLQSGAGWVKLPNGLLLQWGSHTFGDLAGGQYSNLASMVFPVPFPNNVFQVVAGVVGDATAAIAFARNFTLSGFQMVMEEFNGRAQGSNCGANYWAIGN